MKSRKKKITSTIQKYMAEGVLNYVDNESPRNYFLYDGIIDEEPTKIYRLVEDLCNENMAQAKVIKSLEKVIEIYERERIRFHHSHPEMPRNY